MNVSAVDSLLSQMRAAVAQAEGRSPSLLASSGASRGVGASQGTSLGTTSSSGAVDFASVLKSSLDQVAQTQNQAQTLEQRFAAGDPRVSLSDAMIGMQKANISLQATIQVRNRLVSAYNDIMNMTV